MKCGIGYSTKLSNQLAFFTQLYLITTGSTFKGWSLFLCQQQIFAFVRNNFANTGSR
jgi:hypothetical protein